MSLDAAVEAKVREAVDALLPEIEERVAARLRVEAALDLFVDTREAATIAGVSTKTLERLRRTGGGPTFRRTGTLRGVCYRVRDLHAWLATRARNNNQDLGGKA